jgi:hypothetical protein
VLGYRKRSFAAAHALLQTLRANLEDLKSLKVLQKLLLNEIVRAEEKSRGLKAELITTRGSGDRAAVKRTAYLQNRINGFRRCAYIWRCFGDAIAFLYMDKFALKQCFYSTENTNPRQDAGFIAGKKGLARELLLLDSALKHNVPAVLVDLTNTIRYGDICLMANSDPYLIEVKTSKKLDRRSRKQRRSLEKLQTFYETDRGKGLRGFPELRRQIYEVPERTHVDQINECMAEAQNNGYAVRQPERGLYFLVLTNEGPHLAQAMSSLELKDPLVFFLNQQKSERTWAPYSPFVLTIANNSHLWHFIQGNLFIFVFVELGRLCEIALEKGYSAKFDWAYPDYPLRIEAPGGDGTAGISRHILNRIGMEFVSPEWIVLSSIERLKCISESAKAKNNAATSV